ncbi:MAG: superoxide dismutase [Burkholderiales bacterium]|nr:superoxide dismutase [Burkholderiales bacterium]
MNAIPRELPFDAASLPGLSERLLLSHHQNNYGGAVKRLNAIRARLGAAPRGTLPGFELNGLKREELIAANSMLLHELYFDSLAAQPGEMVPAMALALAGSFGSVDAWRDEFAAMGKALGGGSGWVLLSLLPREGLLVNQWAADHTNALVGAIPILALDMYEHAYHLDFGAAAAGYVEAFMARIDWAKVYERYQQAVHACSEGLAADADGLDLSQTTVLDVRRAGVFAQAQTMLPGSRWRDPAHVTDWAGEVLRDRDVLVYCIYGHEVGRATAMKLRALGVQARFLPGGIDGWTRAGRPVQARGGEA